MDPRYFLPGFGGRKPDPSSEQSQPILPPAFHAPPRDRSVKISSGASGADSQESAGTNPAIGENTTDSAASDAEAEIPASMRYMQEAAARSPSTDWSSSASPRRGPVQLRDEDELDDQPGVSESFHDSSLTEETQSAASRSEHLQDQSPSAPHEDELISAAVLRKSGPPSGPNSLAQYQDQDGRVTAERTGSSNPYPPSTALSTSHTHRDDNNGNVVDGDNGSGSVSHTAILKSVLALEEANKLHRAFDHLQDAVGRFRDEMDESLTRLRQGAYRSVTPQVKVQMTSRLWRRQQHAVQGTSHQPSYYPPESDLANARQIALASQLKGTRTKLGQASKEIADLKARLAESEDQLKLAAVQLKVQEAKKLRSVERLSRSKRRGQELAGRLIRLSEENEVLANLQHEQAVRPHIHRVLQRNIVGRLMNRMITLSWSSWKGMVEW